MPTDAAGPNPKARRVLLASLFTPPSTVSATRRPAALARELGALGYEVTVLTSAVSGEGPIAGAAAVARTPDLLTTRLNWRRQNVEALKGKADAAYDANPSTLALWMPADLQLVTWIPFATRQALRLHRDARFDCIVTTGPPHSVHVIGLALKRRGVPWIADLQDGWTFERPMARPPVAQRLDERLERAVLARADRVVGVTDAMANDAKARFAASVATAELGFDADESAAASVRAEAVRSEHLRDGKHSLVYTGSMAYSGQSPAQFLDGLRVFRKRHPDLARDLDVVFAGPVSIQERALFEQPDVRDNIRLLGSLPREDALALQHAADTLLVIIDDTRLGITTNKVFEYLAAGRPIIVVGAGSEAARIVDELRAGVVVHSRAPEEISDALVRALRREVPSVQRGEAFERYSQAAVARRFADVIEDIAA